MRVNFRFISVFRLTVPKGALCRKHRRFATTEAKPHREAETMRKMKLFTGILLVLAVLLACACAANADTLTLPCR